MKIHEYQAKELLGSYGIAVPEGMLASTEEEAYQVAGRLGRCVVKAQIHSGARGKAGGVKLAETPEDARRIAGGMLGMRLVTRQTGPEGRLVRKVLISQALDIRREYYLSMTTDAENARLMLMVSSAGGMEIEETAKTDPCSIVQIPVSVVEGFKDYEGRRASDALGLDDSNRGQLMEMLRAMTRLYLEKDCSLIEINPLAETSDGRLVCLDAKVGFDDNALFRHPDVLALRDVEEEDPKEYKASLSDLSYVSLDGDIGCLVNGAGLAMATMDMIRNLGGRPANFLDVGGSATIERVKSAFGIILSGEGVKAIFVNIFGGIMKCDIIAEGFVGAAREMGVNIPIVVRLEGTNVELGRRVIRESGLAIISAKDMADGARAAIEAAKRGSV